MAVSLTAPGPRLEASERRVRDVELRLLAEGIRDLWGCDVMGTRPAHLEAAARRRQEAEGLAGLHELQTRVFRDETALRLLLREIFGAGGRVFEDAAFYRGFRSRVVPRLRTYPSVRVWVPSCASGEQAVSLAVILEEEGFGDRARVYATAECESLLEELRAGRLDGPPERLDAAHRRAGGKGRLSRFLRRRGKSGLALSRILASRLIVGTHSLSTDDSLNEFQAIVATRVLSRSGPSLRARSLELFHRSLDSFGFLGLGREDTLADSPYRHGYAPVPGARRFYRRIR
jgi:chemotaxis protein methyltransferase CheR